MTTRIDESYKLGAFRDNEGSLRRLKLQASVVTDLEFEHLKNAGLDEAMRVMDIGCGPGNVSSEIFVRTSPRKLVAVDCNDVCLAEARRQLQKHSALEIEVRNGNIYDDLSAADEKFDFIYSRLLFQHLSDPLTAAANAKKSLAPRGRFCICDVDDRWLTTSPDVPELPRFLKRVAAAQAARGGDRHVGSKLSGYLQRSGYTDIRCTSLLVSTDLIGKHAFCDLVFGYKIEVVPTLELEAAKAERDAALASIHSAGGWAGLAVFFVSGRHEP